MHAGRWALHGPTYPRNTETLVSNSGTSGVAYVARGSGFKVFRVLAVGLQVFSPNNLKRSWSGFGFGVVYDPDIFRA